jgi:hypothetical protein
LSFWSSVQAKRASESVFFLFPFFGGRKWIQKSTTRVERFQGAGGVLLFFSFLLSGGVFGVNGISLPQLEALENTGHGQAWGLQRLLTSKQARARGSRKYFTGQGFWTKKQARKARRNFDSYRYRYIQMGQIHSFIQNHTQIPHLQI